ncbi:39S ribosomal protein L35, mitochondrial [Apodemus speciosus]|uniref:Large ribosomal subunit protein bL35m n=1 Tax=Apodemus speciosus TaxID=105296 RepID=A0ABQ0EVT6_APOSI
MAASILTGAVRAASGIVRPLSVLASSAYRNCAKNACLSSALRTIHLRHIQTSLVSSAPRLVTYVGHLTYGPTATVLNSFCGHIGSQCPEAAGQSSNVLQHTERQEKDGKIGCASLPPTSFWPLAKEKGAGYKKKLWKKSTARKKRLREFVFCSKTQSKLLDKMTTSFWKRRNWYAGDPYQMYHDRTNLRV